MLGGCVMEYYLITFSSTHAAIAAQNHLKGKLSFAVMPTLREISNSCGISIRINNASLEEIEKQMQGFSVGDKMFQIYHIAPNQITKL